MKNFEIQCVFDDSFSTRFFKLLKWVLEQLWRWSSCVYFSHIETADAMKTQQVSHVLSLCSRRTMPLIHSFCVFSSLTSPVLQQKTPRWWCRTWGWSPWLRGSRRWWWFCSVPVPLCPVKEQTSNVQDEIGTNARPMFYKNRICFWLLASVKPLQ